MARREQDRKAMAALGALAQPTRLDVFRRLVKSYPDEFAAGDLARQYKAPHNTMSVHLGVLARANLITSRKDGRMMYYRANLPGFQALMNFLLQDCCQGRAEICAPLFAKLSCCEPELKEKTERRKVHV